LKGGCIVNLSALIVDHNIESGEISKDMLFGTEMFDEVVHVDNSKDALKLCEEKTFNLVAVDYNLDNGMT